MFVNFFTLFSVLLVSLHNHISYSYQQEMLSFDDDNDPVTDDTEIEDIFKKTFDSQEPTNSSIINTIDSIVENERPEAPVNVRICHNNFEGVNVKRAILQSEKLEEKVASTGQKNCFSCYHEIKADDKKYAVETNNCYTGVDLPTEKCVESGLCFTEINVDFIRRGCTIGIPDQRFVCSCDYCNDKVANDSLYYTYPKLADMVYDNEVINRNDTQLHLRCKYCETTKENAIRDQFCLEGFNAHESVCNPNEVCFTHIKEGGHHVSRGCVKRPAYNSLFTYCEYTECNRLPFASPRIQRSALGLAYPNADDGQTSNSKKLRSFSFEIYFVLFNFIKVF